MTKGVTVERQFHVRRGRYNCRQLRNGDVNTDVSERVPRVSQLMALAIRFDQLIRDGVVVNQAELARLGRVSRARLTQIMELLCLAPEIQEQILDLPIVLRGREHLSERNLRPLVAQLNWHAQRAMWRQLSQL